MNPAMRPCCVWVQRHRPRRARNAGVDRGDTRREASCCVAVVRSHAGAIDDYADWIVTAMDDRPDNYLVVDTAMRKARMRMSPLLLLSGHGAHLDEGLFHHTVHAWRRRYPGVRVYPLPIRVRIEDFLADNYRDCVRMAVISGADADLVASIIGPHRRPLTAHGECSVLVVR